MAWNTVRARQASSRLPEEHPTVAVCCSSASPRRSVDRGWRGEGSCGGADVKYRRFLRPSDVVAHESPAMNSTVQLGLQFGPSEQGSGFVDGQEPQEPPPCEQVIMLRGAGEAGSAQEMQSGIG
jgi:hypothetical protein